MDKTRTKIRKIGKVFNVLLTIFIIFAIVCGTVCVVGIISLLVIPDDSLPPVLSQNMSEFFKRSDDGDIDINETYIITHDIDESDIDNMVKYSISEVVSDLGNKGIFRIDLSDSINESDITFKIVVIILFAAIISYLAYLIIYAHVLRSMIRTFYRNEKPFSFKSAKKLRRISYVMLIFILITEPMVSLILFAVTFIFSYMCEYGAYLQEKADETNRIQEEMIMSFAEVTENKSEQTGKHVRRVAEYSKILAEEMGLPDEQAETIHLASTMHDIGKLMIPAEILEKPARLTDEEYAEIKKHSAYGGQLLSNVEGNVMQLAKTIALDHHERIDGRGYPVGKEADDISIEGRIVAVADVYDALTSKRSYKEAWDDDRAYNEIIKGSGTQFDENVVEAFKRSYDRINEMRLKYADAV